MCATQVPDECGNGRHGCELHGEAESKGNAGADGSNRASDRRKPDCEHRQRKRGRVRDHLTARGRAAARQQRFRRQRSSRRAAEASPDQPGAHGAETEDPDQHRPDARDARTCHDRCDAEQVVEPGELRREDVSAELLTVPERIDCGEIDALVEVRSVVKESAFWRSTCAATITTSSAGAASSRPLFLTEVLCGRRAATAGIGRRRCRGSPCDSTYARPLRPISSRSWSARARDRMASATEIGARPANHQPRRLPARARSSRYRGRPLRAGEPARRGAVEMPDNETTETLGEPEEVNIGRRERQRDALARRVGQDGTRSAPSCSRANGVGQARPCRSGRSEPLEVVEPGRSVDQHVEVLGVAECRSA